MKWEDYKQKKLKNPEFKKAYEELEVEYAIMDEMLRLRGEAGMSQSQLSAKTGITQPDISKLENGKANPSISTLKKWLGHLVRNYVSNSYRRIANFFV